MAWERGIPVVTYDCDSPESKRLAYVGWEHPMIGAIGAKYLTQLHPEKTGKLATFAAFPEGVYARGRFEGFFNVLDENGYNLDVVGPFKLGLDMAEGYGVVENTFLANPDIEIIYTVDEFVQVPAEYVKRNNLKGKVIVIGVNDLPGVLTYVREGIIHQTTGINPAGQGYITGKMLYEFITTGKKAPDVTYVQLDEVTPENVEEHMKAKGLL
jgi:ABC-type sugar transport system substrate-binding protein